MSKSKKITIVDIRADDEVRDGGHAVSTKDAQTCVFVPIIKSKAEAVEDTSSEHVRDVPIEQIVPNEPTVVN